MVRFLADHTTVRRRLFSGFPDDQPNPLGAEPHGGRSLDSEACPLDELGAAASRSSVDHGG